MSGAALDVVLLVLPLVVASATFVAIAHGRSVVPVRLPHRTGTAGHVGSTIAALLRGVRCWREARSQHERLADDLPDLVELMLVAASSGGNVRRAVEVAASRHRGPAAELLQAVLREVALGHRLGDALVDIVDALDARSAEVVRPAVAVIIDCDHYGTALVPALQRLADDLRVHRQRRAETRARRVPVRLLLPLVLFVLPAFALLTVAPLFAGMARDALADQNAPFEGTLP